jgi:glycosyltransferase involved in cell wall biosynthesis
LIVITQIVPEVSIVILNYQHPEIIPICLETLDMTRGVEYEVVVMDNGSDAGVVEDLRKYKEEGLITTLVENPVNSFFSEGNNIGVRHTNPSSAFILLLNSDVAFLREDWLVKMMGWMEGTIEYWPSVWGLTPTEPTPGPKDIISIGWSHDANVQPGNARPEGWCLLMRREAWREMDPGFPWHNGIDLMITSAVRDGFKCGVLSQYGNYLVHRECASGKIPEGSFTEREASDLPGWYDGLFIETLDFTLGPNEHGSYLWW